MNEPKLINIYLLHPNPYQVRQVEDKAAVAELAANIEKNGLLQPPTVRPAGDQYEIAFGHTRRAAYKLLSQTCVDRDEDGKPDGSAYDEMPCFVRELDDLQMFEMAVAENIKRRDLNPIERARAMQTYMQKFEKTSSQTGEFFGCDEATVRGSVRLLGLPETAQVKLSAGEITVGGARSLLTLERIAPERVEAAMNGIIQEHRQPEAAILSELSHLKTAQTMQESYGRRKTPMAGEGLWELGLEPKKFPRLPLLTQAQAQDAGAIDKQGGKCKDEIKGWINQLEGGLVAAEALIAQGAPAETIEKLAHLVNPPACDRCAYYVTAGGTHVCGWKACWERKALAWNMGEAEKLSEKLGIAIYEEGEYIQLVNDYSNEQKEAFTSRKPGLRLKVERERKSWGRYPYTNSAGVTLVDISPEAVQASRDEEAKRESDRAAQIARQTELEKERKTNQVNITHSVQFYENLAVPVFATMWDAIKNQQLFEAIFQGFRNYYIQDINGKEIQYAELPDDENRTEVLRRFLTRGVLKNKFPYDLQQRGPLAVAEHLQAVAMEWDVKLPEDWLEKAQAFAENPPKPKPEEEDDEEENNDEEEEE